MLSFSKPINSAILFGSSEFVLIDMYMVSANQVNPNERPEEINVCILPAPTKKEKIPTPIIKTQYGIYGPATKTKMLTKTNKRRDFLIYQFLNRVIKRGFEKFSSDLIVTSTYSPLAHFLIRLS